MTYNEFIKEYLGKGIDYDGGYGVQCVDLAKLYMDKVLNIQIGAIGNAEAYYRRYDELNILKDNFDRIPNTPDFIPQRGDLVIWNEKQANGCGHISLATGEGNTKNFNSYDQNWGIKEMHLVNHTYKNVAGVLRAKNQDNINGPRQIIDERQPIEERIGEFILDLDLYNSLYPDLQKAFKNDFEALKNHFYNNGVKENRIASYIFNPEYYYNKYNDLQEPIGFNTEALFHHFINCGIKEGRQGNNLFDVTYYKSNNPDLVNLSNEEAVNHFLTYGINEFRMTSSEFNVNTYKTNNIDLQNAFKDNSKEYYKHYLLFGKNENRKII